jgi:hypothetical protein
VCGEGETGRGAAGGTCGVGEGGVWGKDELVAEGEAGGGSGGVEGRGGPDGVAGRVAVPLRVWDGGVAEVV